MSPFQHDHAHLTSRDPEKVVEFNTKVMGVQIVRVQERSGLKMADISHYQPFCILSL